MPKYNYPVPKFAYSYGNVPPEDYEGPVYPPIPAGEHLVEMLEEYGIPPLDFALATGLSPSYIDQILDGSKPITAEAALRIGKALRMSAETWLRLQLHYDLETASDDSNLSQIQPLIPPLDEIPLEPEPESETDDGAADAQPAAAAASEPEPAAQPAIAP